MVYQLAAILCTLQDMQNVVGDVVVSAGTIAYSGPFTPNFRASLLEEWRAMLHRRNVPHTPGTNIIMTLQVLILRPCTSFGVGGGGLMLARTCQESR